MQCMRGSNFFSRGWGPGDTCMSSQGFQGGGGGSKTKNLVILQCKFQKHDSQVRRG